MSVDLISVTPANSKRPATLRARVTRRPDWVLKALALRYHIFAEELGARLHSPYPGLDWDEIDNHCDHLVVYNQRSRQVVGTTRLFNDHQAAALGRFYSESEFQLNGVLGLQGRFLEVGRTCIDSGVRGSAVLTVLWSELANYARRGGYDYLMGCASIPAGPDGRFAVDAVYRQIDADRRGPTHLNVIPKQPVPQSLRGVRDENGIPPLLKTYLRLGAWVCGEPCWDPDFNVMDVFILLPLNHLSDRYERHFFNPSAYAGRESHAALQ